MENTKVKFIGWDEGFQKVSMNHLLREKANCSLSQAHEIVGDILNKTPIEIDVPSSEVDIFIREARKLGAKCEVISQQG